MHNQDTADGTVFFHVDTQTRERVHNVCNVIAVLMTSDELSLLMVLERLTCRGCTPLPSAGPALLASPLLFSAESGALRHALSCNNLEPCPAFLRDVSAVEARRTNVRSLD
jgi:hypothetical protein